MSRRSVVFRLALAALLVLPCLLLIFRPADTASNPALEDELPLRPAVQLSRESKPTIVKPNEDWMDGSNPHEAHLPGDATRELDSEPTEVPFLPPPLQTADERAADRL